jgi:hypothetical protein
VTEAEQDKTIRAVLAAYDLPGRICGITRLVNGHINDTYQVKLEEEDRTETWILQRINDYVFKDPLLVMNNIRAINEYLDNQLDANDCGVIHSCHRDGIIYTEYAGGIWRLCLCAHSVAYEQWRTSRCW